jgi:TRAP-type C4-dicarboxylate transport system permease small subunit
LPQRIVEIAGYLLGLSFFALVCWGSFDPALHAWTSNEFEGEGALRVPVWPARYIIILGTFLAALNYLLTLIERLRAPLSEPMRTHASEVAG